MSNTVIQIRRSTTANTPNTLNVGELGYSFKSNTLFIGDPNSNVIIVATNTTHQIAQTAANIANAAYAEANAAFAAANGALSANGGTLSGNLIISQDLTVNGNVTIVGTFNALVDGGTF